MLPPYLPHSPDPIVLIMGVIMLTVLITTLIRDEEEWQQQASMPTTIPMVILEQQHQEQGESDGALARKQNEFISWNHGQAWGAVREYYWGPLPRFNDCMFERVF
jgi:hypothetical protein